MEKYIVVNIYYINVLTLFQRIYCYSNSDEKKKCRSQILFFLEKKKMLSILFLILNSNFQKYKFLAYFFTIGYLQNRADEVTTESNTFPIYWIMLKSQTSIRLYNLFFCSIYKMQAFFLNSNARVLIFQLPHCMQILFSINSFLLQ